MGSDTNDGVASSRWAYQSRQASWRTSAARPAVASPTTSITVRGDNVPNLRSTESSEVPLTLGVLRSSS